MLLGRAGVQIQQQIVVSVAVHRTHPPETRLRPLRIYQIGDERR
jgi:hypothetical protein